MSEDNDVCVLGLTFDAIMQRAHRPAYHQAAGPELRQNKTEQNKKNVRCASSNTRGRVLCRKCGSHARLCLNETGNVSWPGHFAGCELDVRVWMHAFGGSNWRTDTRHSLLSLAWQRVGQTFKSCQRGNSESITQWSLSFSLLNCQCRFWNITLQISTTKFWTQHHGFFGFFILFLSSVHVHNS